MTVRDGTKCPIEVEVATARVRAKLGHRIGPEERLLVVRTVGPDSKTVYALGNAAPEVPLSKLVHVRSERHRVERVLQEAKGGVGLAHYEVPSWVGWHHHVRLALVALWFLILERQRLEGKNPGGGGGGAGAGDFQRVAPQASGVPRRDCRDHQSGLAA